MPEIFEVELRSGEVLRGNYWKAEHARFNLAAITGMDEYSLRYDRFAKWMNEQGVNVWVLDAFGQGINAASVEEQERWPKKAFSKQVRALSLMVKLARRNGLPTYLFGHSMGSFMVQSSIQHDHRFADGIIICGSNGGQGGLMKMGYFLSKLLVNEKNRNEECPVIQNMSLGGYTKAVKNRRTDSDWLSYDEENVDAYIADPWCGKPNTGGFWKEFLCGMSTLWDTENMKKVSKDEKILLIAGADDPVGQNGKGVRWLENAYKANGVSNVTAKIYPNMRHEILNEAEREKVFADIMAFMQGKVIQ